MKIVITGGHGFIGKNLNIKLKESGFHEISIIGKGSSFDSIKQALAEADFIFHLAGVNRPKNVEEFQEGNVFLIKEIIEFLKSVGRAPPILFTSSIQAELNNDYGRSKLEAEMILEQYARENKAIVFPLRLPNIFGKWSRPFYNSAIATFCYQISRGNDIVVHDPNCVLQLMYIDDLCTGLVHFLDGKYSVEQFFADTTIYKTTVGEVAQKIKLFADSRNSLVTETVGGGLTRALYSTYISFLQPDSFSYKIPCYRDQRGIFVEMLKTKDAGQFSFFTAHPGVTRGGHYHHSKTEKFLVIKGRARFCFRHIDNHDRFEIETDGESPQIVETIPGWAHDVTNIGDSELVVMLWANEIFDREKPDTYQARV